MSIGTKLSTSHGARVKGGLEQKAKGPKIMSKLPYMVAELQEVAGNLPHVAAIRLLLDGFHDGELFENDDLELVEVDRERLDAGRQDRVEWRRGLLGLKTVIGHNIGSISMGRTWATRRVRLTTCVGQHGAENNGMITVVKIKPTSRGPVVG